MASGTRVYLLAALALMAAYAVQAQPERRPSRESHPVARQRVFEGTSRKGSVDEALQNAVAAALRSLPGADRMVRYRVRDITGESGGIAGLNVVRVTIELPAEETSRSEAPEILPELTAAEIRSALELDLRVLPERPLRAENVTFELTVRNRGDRLVTLPFSSGKQFDFDVTRNDRPVARWSTGRTFPQALSSVTLGPGQSINFTGRWNLRGSGGGAAVAPGTYRLRGFLPTTMAGLTLVRETSFTVGSR